MAETLPSGIKKFEATDTVNRNAFNENWEKIDEKFNSSIGHKHTGAAGDAPKISYNDLGDVPSTFPPSAHQHNSADIADATANAIANTVVKRDSNSQAKFGTPTDAAHAATKNYVDNGLSDLAGAGRTTETVKGNADALAAHLAAVVTDSGGIHGLEIEAGTFTPYVYGSSVAGSNTYSSQNGYYYKVGDRVFFELHIIMSAKDVAMAGDLRIGGLPFASIANTGRRYNVGISRFENLNFDETAKMVVGTITENANFIHVQKLSDNTIISNFAASDLGSTSIITASGSYQV